MWNWEAVTVSPDGGGFCGGEEVSTEGKSYSRSSSFVLASAQLGPALYSSSKSSSNIDITGYGIRSGLSVARSSSSLDIGRGLTIINETGVLSTNTNVLRFVGSSLYSDSTINRLSDSTITTDSCLDIDGGTSSEEVWVDDLNGGDSTNHARLLEGGTSTPC